MQRTLSDLSVLEYPSLDYNQKIRDLRRILLNEYDPESCVKSIIFVDLYGNTVEVGTAAWDVSGESFTAIKNRWSREKGHIPHMGQRRNVRICLVEGLSETDLT